MHLAETGTTFIQATKWNPTSPHHRLSIDLPQHSLLQVHDANFAEIFGAWDNPCHHCLRQLVVVKLTVLFFEAIANILPVFATPRIQSFPKNRQYPWLLVAFLVCQTFSLYLRQTRSPKNLGSFPTATKLHGMKVTHSPKFSQLHDTITASKRLVACPGLWCLCFGYIT